MTSALYWLTLTALLTAVIAFPYVLERIARIGLSKTLGTNEASGTSGFDQATEKPATWAKRSHAAHRNALESLPIVTALILVAHVSAVSAGSAALIADAAKTHFVARVAHYLFYTVGIPIA